MQTFQKDNAKQIIGYKTCTMKETIITYCVIININRIQKECTKCNSGNSLSILMTIKVPKLHCLSSKTFKHYAACNTPTDRLLCVLHCKMFTDMANKKWILYFRTVFYYKPFLSLFLSFIQFTVRFPTLPPTPPHIVNMHLIPL